MITKIYLVSCDNKQVYDKFVDNVRIKVPNVKKQDCQTIKFNIINSIIKNLYPSNVKHITLVNKLSKIINNYNNSIFDKGISYIDTILNYGGILIIRVDSLFTMNKLKRYIKRPRYKTIRIKHTSNISKKLNNEYNKYKFDSVIDYNSDIILKKQSNEFIKMHINTLKRIR